MIKEWRQNPIHVEEHENKPNANGCVLLINSNKDDEHMTIALKKNPCGTNTNGMKPCAIISGEFDIIIVGLIWRFGPKRNSNSCTCWYRLNCGKRMGRF